jgi:hypothetical protein
MTYIAIIRTVPLIAIFILLMVGAFTLPPSPPRTAVDLASKTHAHAAVPRTTKMNTAPVTDRSAEAFIGAGDGGKSSRVRPSDRKADGRR